LDKFEKEIRRWRNKFFGKTTFLFFYLAHKCFNLSKPYIHTDLLKTFKEDLNSMLTSVEEEFDLRRKMSGAGAHNQPADQVRRDTSFAIKDVSARSFRMQGSATSMQNIPQ
jgi:hypothetical protein